MDDEARPDPLEVTLEGMQPRVGETFTVIGHEVELTLVEAEPSPQGVEWGFSLLFEGPENPRLAQNTWALNSRGEELHLFLVPVVTGSTAPAYESVFSQVPG
ncbi:MAG: hypothetical protein AAF567_22825 [Actinomycetota bacterium]